MQIKTQGLVIGQVKYTGSKVILQIFTREQGWLSFITRVGGKARPRALTQLCTLVDLDFDFRENQELHTIRQIQLADVRAASKDSMIKSAVEMFIAELLYRCLHRNYVNTGLFDNIRRILLELDQADNVSMFPIEVLLILSSDLGFDIPLPEQPYQLRFDPVEGQFAGDEKTMSAEEADLGRAFIKVLSDFNNGHIESIAPSTIRKEILDLLIANLKERLELKSTIKSHEVLEVILHH